MVQAGGPRLEGNWAWVVRSLLIKAKGSKESRVNETSLSEKCHKLILPYYSGGGWGGLEKLKLGPN